MELSLPRTYNLTLIDCLIIYICICFTTFCNLVFCTILCNPLWCNLVVNLKTHFFAAGAKVPGNESSRERKFHPMELSLPGAKVPAFDIP